MHADWPPLVTPRLGSSRRKNNVLANWDSKFTIDEMLVVEFADRFLRFNHGAFRVSVFAVIAASEDDQFSFFYEACCRVEIVAHKNRTFCPARRS